MNLLELWWLLEKPVFQEVGSGFHKKFDQLLDHSQFSCESVDAMDLKTFSWNCRPLPSSCNFSYMLFTCKHFLELSTSCVSENS